MANTDHVELLLESVKEWNAWRRDNPDIVPDLSHADLSFADLSRADLSRANLSRAGLSGAGLTGAGLRYANLSRAGLTGADLAHADLRYANLAHADLRYANLSRADLSRAGLRYANLSRAGLTGAGLAHADLDEADLDGAILIDVKGLPQAPSITDLDAKILAIAERGDESTFDMCDTALCRAGNAVMLAGDEGASLVEKHGWWVAGAAIYQASTGRIPEFYATNKEAIADMRAMAGVK